MPIWYALEKEKASARAWRKKSAEVKRTVDCLTLALSKTVTMIRITVSCLRVNLPGYRVGAPRTAGTAGSDPYKWDKMPNIEYLNRGDGKDRLKCHSYTAGKSRVPRGRDALTGTDELWTRLLLGPQ